MNHADAEYRSSCKTSSLQTASSLESLAHADHMDKRGRQHRTWPGAGRNGSMRPPDHLVHSRSAPLPNDLIVSLLPSGTEVLFALGLGNRCSAPHHMLPTAANCMRTALHPCWCLCSPHRTRAATPKPSVWHTFLQGRRCVRPLRLATGGGAAAQGQPLQGGLQVDVARRGGGPDAALQAAGTMPLNLLQCLV